MAIAERSSRGDHATLLPRRTGYTGVFPAGIRAAPFPAYAWLPPARLLLEPVNGSRTPLYVDKRASWQGGLWGWQWVGAAVVAEVGEEVEAVVAREWKQGLARGSGEGGGPVNWTWCCCYLHAALSTCAAELLTSRSSAHLRRMGWGAPELAEHICE